MTIDVDRLSQLMISLCNRRRFLAAPLDEADFSNYAGSMHTEKRQTFAIELKTRIALVKGSRMLPSPRQEGHRQQQRNQ
jgi:hypothetical protein